MVFGKSILNMVADNMLLSLPASIFYIHTVAVLATFLCLALQLLLVICYES